MNARKKPVRVSLITSLACVAGAAPQAVHAQDCKLAVQATPQVLYSGQRANVSVFAQFPSPPTPGAPYAFAAAELDVLASDPAWTFASAGTIVGNDVLDIHVSQPHAPQSGTYADPANPYLLWRGILSPQATGPALIEVAADPARVSMFPTRVKTYTCPADAAGGSDWLFVNPLSVGSWLAAPAAGTEARVHDDVVIDGRIITGENYDSACIGLFPARQSLVSESSTRVSFIGQPVTFTATVQAQDAQRSRVTSLTVTFSGLESGDGSAHCVGGNYLLADGSVRFLRYEGYLGGIRVAAGDLAGDGANGAPGLIVNSLPQTIGARLATGNVMLASSNTYQGTTLVNDGVILLAQYDSPITALVRGDDGRQRVVTLDEIEVQGDIREAAARISSSNNLKQLGLGCHVFEAAGAQQMTIAPQQPE